MQECDNYNVRTVLVEESANCTDGRTVTPHSPHLPSVNVRMITRPFSERWNITDKEGEVSITMMLESEFSSFSREHAELILADTTKQILKIYSLEK